MYSVIRVGIGIVAVTTVVAMIDHHTVVVLPLDVKMVMTTGLLSILGVWDIQEAFLVISLDCIPVVKVISVQKNLLIHHHHYH